MIDTILRYTQIALGIVTGLLAIGLLVFNIRTFLKEHTKMKEAQHLGERIFWYTDPSILSAIARVFLPLGLLFLSFTSLVGGMNREVLVIRLVLGLIGLSIILIGLLMTFRGRSIRLRVEDRK